MKKKDLILILLFLAVAAVSFPAARRTSPADIASITADGKHFCTVALNENREININGTNIAVVENGQIYMKSASCPDKLCVKQGRISDSSKKIVCLPNKVVIEALGKGNADTVVK